jgi:hypothetical protein
VHVFVSIHVTVNCRSYGHNNGCHHAEMESWIRSGACVGSGVTYDDYDDYYGGVQDNTYKYTCSGNGELFSN